MSDSSKLSSGFLPLAPLSHDDPTATGLWDMESGAGVTPPEGGTSRAARDQIVLARMHGQPVAILHVQLPPGQETHDDLLSATWRDGHDRIVAHVRACACMEVPTDLDTLGGSLDHSDGSCRGRKPDRPAGHAAVILCTTGRAELLARTLDSLTQMRCEDFEIVVVDNRPSLPGTRALVEGFRGRAEVRYVAEQRPGLATARNTGVAAAGNAEFVAFTDDDVVVDPEWLSWLLAPFTDPAVDSVTGLVMPLSLGSPVQKRFEQYAGFGKGVTRGTYDLGPHRADRFLYPYWGGMFGSGNSMAFRRDTVRSIGGFDPALGAGTPTGGGEDIAAFSDVILEGGSLVYEPRSLCWHQHRSAVDSLEAQVRNYGIGLTAVFWRYLWKDRRFTATVLRSIPSTAKLALRRSDEREQDRLPADLARLESRGRLLGPWRYVVSSRASRRG